EVRLAAVQAALQAELTGRAPVPERLGLRGGYRNRLGPGRLRRAGLVRTRHSAARRGPADDRAERPLHLVGQAVQVPRLPADQAGDRLGVVVERDLEAHRVHDPPGDPAGPLTGQVGD